MSASEERPTVVRDSDRTTNKTLLSVIITANKNIHVQITSRSETIESAYFVNFLQPCGTKWRDMRTDPTHLNGLLLQFDNARPQCLATSREFFDKRIVRRLRQAPYSLDMNLCDRWVFLHLKREFEGIVFTNSDEVVETTLQTLRDIPQSGFQNEIEKLLDHCELVIDNNGDYITY